MSPQGAQELLQLIQDGLADEHLFPKINLSACHPVTSLYQLQKSAPMLALSGLFTDSQLDPRVGYNQGTGDLSITVIMPRDSQFKQEKRQAVIWMMLGLFAQQEEIELAYASLSPAEGRRKLSNECLRVFMQQTHVAIIHRRLELKLRMMRLRFDTAKKGISQARDGKLYTDSMQTPFWYSPSYARMTGLQPDGEYSDELVENQRRALVDDMVGAFWAQIEKQRYFPDPSLRDQVTHFLRDYVYGGIVGQTEMFSPHSGALSLYLHGTAGIGKSSFVLNLCKAFDKIIDQYLEPGKRFAIIRIPFNSITVVDLQRILLVKGISDWSIERIVEQTIVRGGIAIVHLEECPPDPKLQEDLFGLAQRMLKKVAHRYPEYSSNLLYILTSNYSPAPALAQIAKEVHMKAPGVNIQHEWCARKLEDCIAENVQLATGTTVHCKLQAPPPLTNDMRILEKWNMSVGFLCATHLGEHLVANADRAGKQITVVLSGNPQERTMASFKVTAKPDLADSDSEASIPDLSMSTQDGYFFHLDSDLEHIPALMQYDLDADQRARVAMVTRMMRAGFLRPAVVVLAGPTDNVARLAEAWRTYLRHCLADKLHETNIKAFDDSDKEAIFGDPSDAIMRGLFRWLDDITNPVHNRGDDYGVVTSHVNEYGQFMLRELLENSDSKTHRMLIRKDRITFLVCVEEGSPISPQLESRAHVIFRA